jgi:ribosomal protein L11 methyltransferase
VAWQVLELRLTAPALPQAEALLALLGAAAVTLAGEGHEEILEPDPGAMPIWRSLAVRALFPAEFDLARGTQMLSATLGDDVAITASQLADADWTGAVAAQPREQFIGQRLTIAPASAPPELGGRVVVRLRRGLGFGTGDHPTTRLCLEWLDAQLAPGATVLDYGCGSGVLAIAALRLGANYAWALDIEPQALEGTADNAALNAVADRLWIGSPAALPDVVANVILANILARPLIGLVARFDTLLGESGTLVLSGLLENQLEQVRRAYADRFAVLAAETRDGWVRLIARRRHG